MAAGLLGNKSSYSNRLIPVFQSLWAYSYGVRLQAKLGSKNPTGLPVGVVSAVCENALVNIYGNREFLGKVYIDKALRNYTVPFLLRSAGKTMTAVSRGSRIAIDDSAKIIRPFIWWTNTKDDIIDIDLSVAVFADDWNCLEHVSYSNLKSEKFGICHSGDITNGGPVDGEGAAEFIDLDIDKALVAGARYAVFNVYNFLEENFSRMEHAAFGFMTRNDMKSGEIFEPSTVKQRMDLASATTTCIPVIFDLKERVFIWCDMALTADHVKAGYGGINVESNLPSVVVTCKAMVDVKKPNLYDLFTFNAKARGVITDNPDEADIRFGLDDNCDVKPSDIDVIVGKYL